MSSDLAGRPPWQKITPAGEGYLNRRDVFGERRYGGAVIRRQPATEIEQIEVELEKGAFYASVKIIGRLAEALNMEPAELLRLPTGGDKT